MAEAMLPGQASVVTRLNIKVADFLAATPPGVKTTVMTKAALTTLLPTLLPTLIPTTKPHRYFPGGDAGELVSA